MTPAHRFRRPRPNHKAPGSPDGRRSSRRDAGFDFARQPFTMSNHRVEILFHSGRGGVCLELPGSRRCCSIIRGRLLFRRPAIRNLFKMASVHLQFPCNLGQRNPGQRSVQRHRCSNPSVNSKPFTIVTGAASVMTLGHCLHCMTRRAMLLWGL
jgi:hypothetical protein